MGKMVCALHGVRIQEPKMGFVDLRLGHKISGLGRSLSREQEATKAGDDPDTHGEVMNSAMKDREGTEEFDFDELAICQEQRERVIDVTNKIEAIEQVLDEGFTELNLFGGVLAELKKTVKRSLQGLQKQQAMKAASASSPLNRSKTSNDSGMLSPKALGN